MIEAIIGLVLALIGGAFLYGRSSKNNKDKESIIESKRNYEQTTRIDDLPSVFDGLREKRRR